MYDVHAFFLQPEYGIRDKLVTGVQTCALPIFQGKLVQNCHRFVYGFHLANLLKSTRVVFHVTQSGTIVNHKNPAFLSNQNRIGLSVSGLIRHTSELDPRGLQVLIFLKSVQGSVDPIARLSNAAQRRGHIRA